MMNIFIPGLKYGDADYPADDYPIIIWKPSLIGHYYYPHGIYTLYYIAHLMRAPLRKKMIDLFIYLKKMAKEIDSIEFPYKLAGHYTKYEFNLVYFDQNDLKNLINPNEIVYHEKSIYIEMVFPEFKSIKDCEEYDEYTEIVEIELDKPFTRKRLFCNILETYEDICMERYGDIMQYYDIEYYRIYRLENDYYYKME